MTRVEWLDSVDSTNEEAKRRAADGEAGPLWTAAHVQTAGRGRRGRDWTSQRGNLFCTLLTRPGGGPDRCAQLAFVAGLAVADMAAGVLDPRSVTLKWPNDLLIAGSKASGILLETGEDGQGRWLAAGIGVNLVSAPEGTPFPATHLSAHLPPGGAAPSPEAALEALAAAFAVRQAEWEQSGFGAIREAWLARAHGLGAPVTARLADGSEARGVFEDMDGTGALVLRTPDGARRAIAAADVFFA